MYEKVHGSKRLVFALQAAATDPAALSHLASYLNYYKPQLAEDIQAIGDYLQELEEKTEDKNNF